MREITPGLSYWTAPHPEWDGNEGWPRDVGCVAADVGDDVVLIDPLVEDWDALDARVAGRPVHVLTTIHYHSRSCGEVLERYGADEVAPPGVEPREAGEETVYWLPDYAALVFGDTVLGDDDGALRVCPQDWLPDGMRREDVCDAVAALTDLPVERALVTHGEPVLAGAREALSAASRAS